MALPTMYEFTRYLAAKKSVDDRALNRHVWQSLSQALRQTAPDGSVQVLEIGAGIGIMVERLVEWGLLGQATYTAIDADAEMIAASRQRLPAWMVAQGFEVRQETSSQQRFRRNGRELVVKTEAIDLQCFVGRSHGRRTW